MLFLSTATISGPPNNISHIFLSSWLFLRKFSTVRTTTFDLISTTNSNSRAKLIFASYKRVIPFRWRTISALSLCLQIPTISSILTVYRIKCDGCNKNLMAMRFSESSKRKWQESIRANRRNPKISIKLPRCVDCTSQSRQEMKCVMCGLVKSLDKFSKKQRQNTDDAVSP